jgi:hypothetical protein
MKDFGTAIVAVMTSVIGLAIVAVIFSRNANTPGVFNSLFGGFAQVIGAAVAPVMGGTGSAGISLPSVPNATQNFLAPLQNTVGTSLTGNYLPQ